MSLTVAPKEQLHAKGVLADVGTRPQPTAWLLLSPVALLAALGGLVLVGRRSGPDVDATDVVVVGLIAVWAVCGASLIRRKSALGRTALAAAAVAGLGYFGAAWGATTASGTAKTLADGLRLVGLAALPVFGLHLLLALPDGELGNRTRRILVVCGYGVAAAVGLAFLAGSDRLPAWLVWAEVVIAVALGAIPAHHRYAASAGVTRQRLQWLGCAVAVAGEVALVVVSLRLLLEWPHQGAAVAGAATVLIPLALIAAATPLVTRVDHLLVTTVSASGLTGVVVGVYLVVVIGLGRVPRGGERQVLLLSMAAAGLASLLYLPARERLTEAANRLVYGERHAPDEVLRTFGSRLSRAIPMDELLLQLAESLRKTMALTTAEVWTGSGEHMERTVSVPHRPTESLLIDSAALPVVARAGVSGGAWVAVWLSDLLTGRADAQLRVAPACHSGEVLGLIVVERPNGGDAFTEADDQALAELARQVGLALHNVQLDSALQASLDDVRRYAGELQQSRARIVATADAERRKIERNLHDGAQQHLVALAVSLRLTRDLIADDPETAASMIDALAADVKETIQELRDLAHGIYPPLLMDSGLPEALRAAAARSPLSVEVDAEVGRYPTETEAAIYFCCLEAMQNAAKHAPEADVSVQVWEDDEAAELCFEVTDDGPGFDVAVATAGHGFVNMNDRLGAIGGTVRWESIEGQGSKVCGSVPTEAASVPVSTS